MSRAVLVAFLFPLIALSFPPESAFRQPKQSTPAVQMPSLKRSMVPAEAFLIAAADQSKLTDLQALTTRYIAITETSPEKVDALRLTLNQLSLASDAVDFAVLADGAIVRVDLAALAPRLDNGDLQRWIDTWELLAFDPYSADLLTRDGIQLLLGNKEAEVPKVQIRKLKRPKTEKPIAVAPAVAQNDGKEPVKPNVEVEIVVPTNEVFEFSLDSPELESLRKQALVRFNGSHIDPQLFLGLQQRLGTLAPVVNYEYFLWRSFTTVKKAITASKNDAVFENLYGGLYYEFAKVRTAKEAKSEKKTDLDQAFIDMGLGENADRLFNDLRSDIRIVMQHSDVTGKNRIVVFYPTPTSEAGNVSLVMFTIDLLDTDIDLRQRHFLNLRNPFIAAIEMFWITPNGLWKTAIFNGEGARLDSVGQDIAADRTVPAPHSPILQPAMGCLSCHVASGHGLFIPVVNELPQLLKTRGDIFADLGDKKTAISDTLDRLRAYSKKTDKLFSRGRDDLNSAVLANIFKRKILPAEELTKIGQTVSQQILRDYNTYRYGVDAKGIGPQQVLLELGFIAESKEQAVKTLTTLLPPMTDPYTGIAIEDPIVLSSLAGLNIPRSDFDLRKSKLAFQSQQVLASLPKNNPMREAVNRAKDNLTVPRKDP